MLSFMTCNDQLYFLQRTCDTKSEQEDTKNGLPKEPKGACCFSFLYGSMTLETSLILPLYILVLVSCMLFGQMLIAKGQMHHGLVEAANELAELEYKNQRQGKTSNAITARVLQERYADMDWMPNVMKIDHKMMLASKIPNEQQEIELKMRYRISLQFPIIGKKVWNITDGVCQKAFTGYEPTDFELGKGYVYVTKYGTVYHNSINCTHIMLKVADAGEVQRYLNGETSYVPCSKCARKVTGTETSLFIAKEGDCYHTSLECSGLTRYIRKITIWEAEGMRPCTRCGG